MDKRVEEAAKWYDVNKALYERFSQEMAQIIEKILKSQKIPYQSISYRVKEKESYLNKCSNDKYKNPIEEIMDVSGIRIIAYTNQDVHRICEILQKQFCIDEENSVNKADILETDKVGYLSVHYVVKMNKDRVKLPEYSDYKEMKSEIQVRTVLQHAWAEIEHDKNYKFAGALPSAIKRRFHLIAGTLEMVDNEFDNLSREIDNYSKAMKAEVAEGNYNLEIDSKTLEQYYKQKFAKAMNLANNTKVNTIPEQFINELLRFGYKTIQEIDTALSPNINKFIIDKSTTFAGMLRNLMIITDCEKYFTESFNGAWQQIKKESVKYLKENGVANIEEYLQKNNIVILED